MEKNTMNPKISKQEHAALTALGNTSHDQLDQFQLHIRGQWASLSAELAQHNNIYEQLKNAIKEAEGNINKSIGKMEATAQSYMGYLAVKEEQKRKDSEKQPEEIPVEEIPEKASEKVADPIPEKTDKETK
jgi:hypothetical protein